jgi:PAS domain S-box-containing protein
MSEPNQLKRLYTQLATPQHRNELAELYQKTLRQALFTSRATVRPAVLKSIAEAEVEAMLECFRAFDPDQARQRGVQLCQAGLGIEAPLHLAQATRHFCLASLPEDLRLPALETVESYHNAVMQGLIQTSEAITLEEQERIRSAFQTTIQRYAAQTALAAEIAGAATSILDMDELLTTSVESIQARFELYYVGIFLMDAQKRWAVLRAGTGEAGQEMLRREHRLEVGSRSMIGWCVAHAQPRIALDVGQEAVRFENPLLPDTHSEMALPLISRSHVIGAMTIQSQRVAAFTEQDITTLRIISDQLANAIENVRLLNETRTRAGELAVLNEMSQALATHLSVDKVLDEVYRGAARVLDTTDFYISLYDPEKNQVTFPIEVMDGQMTKPYSTLPADQGLTGYLIRSRKPLLIQEAGAGQEAHYGAENIPFRPAQSSKCWLGAPMLMGERVLGTLAIMSYTDPFAFGEHDRDLLTAIAGQAAIALENARLFEQTRASEARFRDVALSSADWVWETDTRGRYTFCSERVVEVLGYTAEEMLGKTAFAHLSPQDAARMRSSLMDLFANKQPMVDLEYRKTAKDGREVVLVSNGVPILDDQGNLVGYRGVDKDITERRQMEEAEREQRMWAEALRDSASALASTLSLDEVLDRILEQIAIVVPHDAATVMLIEGDLAYIVRSRGYAERSLALELNSRFRISELPSLHSMVETRQPILISDTDEDPTWVRLPEREWVHSYISAPIQVRGQVIGFLNLNSATRGGFGPQHVRRLLAFADQAGVALDNAHLFEETMKSLVEAEALYRVTQAVSRLGNLKEILQTLANVLVEQVGYRSAWVARVDKQARLLKSLVGAGLPEMGSIVTQQTPLDARVRNPLIQVVFKKEPIVVNDATTDERTLELSEEMRAMLGRTVVVPLLVGSEAVGVMTVHRPLSAPEFTDRDVELLQAVANQASVAWQNNRLLEESQENLLDLQTIANLTTHLLASQDIHQAGNLLVRQVLDHGADLCTITLRNEIGNESGLEIIAAADTDRTPAEQLGLGTRLPLNQVSFIQSAYQNKQALFFPDVDQAVILSDQEKQSQIGRGERALAVLPLVEGGDMVGHLSIGYRQSHEFSLREIGFYTALTGQAAVVIQSIRRLEETRVALAENRALYQISRAVTEAASPQDILHLVVNQALPRGTDRASLMLVNRADDGTPTELEVIGFHDVQGEFQRVGIRLPYATLPFLDRIGSTPLIIPDVNTFSDLDPSSRQTLLHFNIVATCVTPLRIGGQLTGIMTTSARQPTQFRAGDVRLLQNAADQIAISLENHRLLMQTQAALAETETLYQASRRMAAAHDVQQIVAAVAQGLPTSEINQAALFTFDRDLSDEITALRIQGNWHSGQGHAPLPIGTLYPKDLFAPLNLLDSEMPIFFDDAQTSEQMSPAMKAIVAQQNAHALVLLPVKVGHTPLGVLMLAGEQSHRFSARETQSYAASIGQVAIALENQRLLEETQSRARREQILREVAVLISASPDVAASLSDITSQLRQLVPVDTLALVVHPSDAPQVTVQAVHAESETGRWTKSGDHLPLKGSGPGWAITKDQARIEKDVRSTQLFAEDAQLAATGLAARLILPLSVSGLTVGALDLASTQPGAFTGDHTAMLRPVADLMALALERARLLQETRAALSEVEATTRRYLRQQWATYLSSAKEQYTSYWDVEPGLTPARDVWLPEMEQAFVSGIPVNTTLNPDSDEALARAVLAVPIKLRGQPIGVLDFYNEGGERAWGEEEQALVVALADQIASALENTRLFEQTQQRARREQLIAEIAAKMRAAPDVEGILRTTVHEIRRALGVSHGVIHLGEAAHTPAGNGQTDEGDGRDEQ